VITRTPRLRDTVRRQLHRPGTRPTTAARDRRAASRRHASLRTPTDDHPRPMTRAATGQPPALDDRPARQLVGPTDSRTAGTTFSETAKRLRIHDSALALDSDEGAPRRARNYAPPLDFAPSHGRPRPPPTASVGRRLADRTGGSGGPRAARSRRAQIRRGSKKAPGRAAESWSRPSVDDILRIQIFDFEIRANFADAIRGASEFRQGLERLAARNAKWRSSISMSLR
jgi:hypothetical protein